MDGRTLAEELGVGDDRDVIPPERSFDHSRGANWHGGLVHDDGLGRQQGPDLRGGRLDVRQVGGPIGPLRGGYAEVRELAVGHRRGGTHDKAQASVLKALVDEVVQARFEDRDLASLQPLDLVFVDVGTDHVVPDVGEASTGGEAHIPGADDSDPAHDVAPSSRKSRSRDSR